MFKLGHSSRDPRLARPPTPRTWLWNNPYAKDDTMPDNATAAAADRRIQRGGSAMLFAEPVLAQGRVANIDDTLMFYAGGRGGVLGNVPWQQVQSAFGFFPAEIVRNAWHQVTSWGEPLEMAGHYRRGWPISDVRCSPLMRPRPLPTSATSSQAASPRSATRSSPVGGRCPDPTTVREQRPS